MTAGGASIAQG
jgi:hypothetical protein